MPHCLQERQVGVAVGVRRTGSQVEVLALGQIPHAVGLRLGVQPSQRATGVAAVPHFADRAERAVEAEVVGDRVDDLLQGGRDHVDALAPFAVALDEAQRLGIDERTQHGLHRLGDELAHVLDRVAGQNAEPVLGRAAHCLVARATGHEEELPERRLQQLTTGDHAAPAQRAGERESRGPAQKRPVEIEEGGGRHPPQGLRPTAASASSRPA